MAVADPPFQSRAVRANVFLHEQHLRRFLQVWAEARAKAVVLPSTTDPSYQSLETLGHHVLRAARGYLVWICEMLRLPNPGIRPAPEPAAVAAEATGYADHLFGRWRATLADVRDDQLETPEYRSRWGTLYSIDSMLEHAVMHPIRHTFQLEELIAATAAPEPHE
jgi:hypothetical protein